MNKEPTRLKISDLPYVVEKDLSYLKPNPLFNILLVLGIIMIAIGLFNIVFGPDELYISISGPTFGEFLQLYPGPIATAGFLLIAIPNAVNTSQQKKFLKEMTESYELDTEDADLPPEVGLMFNIISENKISIELNIVAAEDEPEQAATEAEAAETSNKISTEKV